MATTSCFTADEIKTFSTMFNKLMKSNDKIGNLNILCIECIKWFPDESINNVLCMITQHFEGMQNLLNNVKVTRTETVNELLEKKEELKKELLEKEELEKELKKELLEKEELEKELEELLEEQKIETCDDLLKKFVENKISVNDMVEKVTGIQGCVMPSNESNDVNRMNKNAIIQAILLLENEMITFDDDDDRTLKYNSLNTVNKKQLILYLVDLQNSEVNVLKNGAAVKKMYLY